MRKLSIISLFLITLIIVMSVSTVAEEGYFYKQEYDLEGETIVLQSWAGNPFEDEAIAAAEEKFNFELEFRTHAAGQYPDTLIARMIAGESENDIWTLGPRLFTEMVPYDVLLSLDDIFPSELFRENPRNHTTVWEGSILGMLGGWDTEKAFGREDKEIPDIPKSGDIVVAYNVDLLEREGLTDPYDLYEADKYETDEWTLETLGEIAKEATRDTTGDGEIDQWGIGAACPAIVFLSAYDRVADRNEEGDIVFTLKEDEVARNKIESLARWNVEENIVFGPHWGGEHSQGVDLFVEGKAAFVITRIMMIDFQDMDDRYRILPLPDYYRSPRPFSMGHNNFMLPANSKNPGAMIAILDYMNDYLTPSREELMNKEYYSYIDEHSVDEKGAQVLFDWHKLTDDIETGDINRSIYNGIMHSRLPLRNELFRIVRGEIGFRAAMDAVNPEIQAFLDDLLGQ